MPRLTVFVDYDNVEPSLTKAGPISLAKLLFHLIPKAAIDRNDSFSVRLYGGWRCNGALTVSAQKLIPDIRSGSPTVVIVPHVGSDVKLKLTVELADRPIGWSVPLDGTLVRERTLRKFRTKINPWPECTTPTSCGLYQFSDASYSTACSQGACKNRLGNIFVRDEQKMVDTLIVADIAQEVLATGATDIVIVSSDADMWPGVLLAVRAGCSVIQVHTKSGSTTQRHLVNTLVHMTRGAYQQVSA